MTNQHRATPDEWAQQEDWGNRKVFSYSSCIIELRGRVEALEATQQPLAFTGKVVAPITRDRDETGDYLIVHDTPIHNSQQLALVDRLAVALLNAPRNSNADTKARTVIFVVAAAILDRWDSEGGSGWEAAKWLEQEANR